MNHGNHDSDNKDRGVSLQYGMAVAMPRQLDNNAGQSKTSRESIERARNVEDRGYALQMC